MATATARKQKPKAQLVKVEKVELLAPDRVTQFLARVTEDLTPFINQQEDMERSVARLVIRDQASRDKASELRQVIAAVEKDGSRIVEESITIANGLHKSLTGIRRKLTDVADKNRRALDAKLRDFDDQVRREQEERDRKAREEAERKIREENERRRQEAAAAAKKAAEDAAEARRKAEEAAAEARKKSDAEAAIRAEAAARESARIAEEAATKQTESLFAEEAAAAPVDVSHVTAAPVVEKPRGESWVDNWKAEVVDRMAFFKFVAGVPADVPIAHPELFNGWMENKSILGAWATAQKGGLSIPGVKVWNDRFMRQSRS